MVVPHARGVALCVPVRVARLGARVPMIISLSMVKNEADIIEAFVRHTLQFVDLMLIADNDSSDGTGDILRLLQREGLPVVIFDDPIFGYFQSEKMTFLYRRAVETYAPRHVMLLDADEFIAVPFKPLFRTGLLPLRPGSMGLIPWRTHVLSPEQAAAPMTDPPRQMRFRRAEEHPEFHPAFHKAVIAVDPQNPLDVAIPQGNHSACRRDGTFLPWTLVEHVALAHFPVRSRDQLTAKVVTGWMAYLAMKGTGQGWGAHWATLYARIVDGPGLSAEDVSRESLRYALKGDAAPDWDDGVVEDPLNAAYEIRYAPEAGRTAVSAIARSWERQMVPNPRLRFADRPGSGGSGGEPAADTAFDPQWHARNFLLDLPPFRHIAERYRPHSVLDLGCGLGGYLRYFLNTGAEQAVGIDGFAPNPSIMIPEHYRQADIGGGIDLGRPFDLVMCMEVIEHIEEAREDAVLDSITRHAAERIVFSAAEPGQPGLGHINCKPIGHWLDKLRRRGWAPDLFDTLAMRSLATFSWFRRNTVVLVRDTGQAQRAIDTLSALAARPVAWPNYPPTVVTHPFFELAGG